MTQALAASVRCYYICFQAMDAVLGRPCMEPQRVARTPTIVGKVSLGKNHRDSISKSKACGDPEASICHRQGNGA